MRLTDDSASGTTTSISRLLRLVIIAPSEIILALEPRCVNHRLLLGKRDMTNRVNHDGAANDA
jgi:hypothetical protein